jgi:hypothetical protein
VPCSEVVVDCAETRMWSTNSNIVVMIARTPNLIKELLCTRLSIRVPEPYRRSHRRRATCGDYVAVRDGDFAISLAVLGINTSGIGTNRGNGAPRFFDQRLKPLQSDSNLRADARWGF